MYVGRLMYDHLSDDRGTSISSVTSQAVRVRSLEHVHVTAVRVDGSTDDFKSLQK